VITWGVIGFKKDLETSTRLYSKVIGEYCISPLAFADHEGAREMLLKIKALPEISGAMLFDEKDSLIAMHSKENINLVTVQKPDSSLAGFQNDYLMVIEPIRYQQVHYGTIVLLASTEFMKEQIRKYVIILVIIMLGLVLLSK